MLQTLHWTPTNTIVLCAEIFSCDREKYLFEQSFASSTDAIFFLLLERKNCVKLLILHKGERHYPYWFPTRQVSC